MELSGSKIKKFLIFSGNGVFSKNLLIFQEMEPSSPKLTSTLFKLKVKKQKQSLSKKSSYIFLYFGEWNFLALLLKNF